MYVIYNVYNVIVIVCNVCKYAKTKLKQDALIMRCQGLCIIRVKDEKLTYRK